MVSDRQHSVMIKSMRSPSGSACLSDMLNVLFYSVLPQAAATEGTTAAAAHAASVDVPSGSHLGPQHSHVLTAACDEQLHGDLHLVSSACLSVPVMLLGVGVLQALHLHAQLTHVKGFRRAGMADSSMWLHRHDC